MRKHARVMSIYMIILLFIIMIYMALQMTTASNVKEPYTYSDLVRDIKDGTIKKVEISKSAEVSNAGNVRAYFESTVVNGRTEQRVENIEVLWMDSFAGIAEKASVENGLQVVTKQIPKTSVLLEILPFALVMMVLVFLMFIVMQQVQGGGSGGSKVMNFGKSRAKLTVDDKKKVTFQNVAGLDEEKAELQELVDFLKSPKKYVDIGARIPKGVLLVGPPGTGKTLLAKAVAGEAGVPFFSISGSDFVEMFVGVGASRVRDLFEQAKKNSPCIVFIDEIDAVGRRRGAGLGGGHDEREQTLNQLLVEMDGFGVNEGVIILAATNRVDILDPALLRPGRFDRRVTVGRPDVKGREQILEVHAKGKAIGPDVDLKVIAHSTSGFTGADLENLLNEAALLSARHNKKEIDMEELRAAFIKVGMGTEKKSRVISDREKNITAYHEAGHGILFELLEQLDPVHIISIIPVGSAGGYTMPLPGDDKSYLSKSYMEQYIVSLLGGRVAEEIVLKDITTGASNDIERATAMARDMVTKYGMSSELGPIQFGNDNDEVFIGRDLAHTRNYGEKVASQIDTEIKAIIEKAHEKARELITKHISVLHKTAELLKEKEKITGDEFRALFPEDSLPDKKRTSDFFEEKNIVAPEEAPIPKEAQ